MTSASLSAGLRPLIVLRLLSVIAVTVAAPLAARGPSGPALTSRSVSADLPLTSAQQTAIDRYVTAEMARQRIPGLALGVYRHGHPIYLRGYGQANLEWQAPMTTDTRMQTGSLGKQFTATALMRLAEQGKVDVDASIRTYFPEAPASWQPIKVANLLSHTSGIGIYDTAERTAPGGAFDYHADFTEEQLTKAIVALPLEFKVGSDWRYNNTNYVLLGILVHRLTGRFYGDYLHDEFFAPLGMRATRVISDTAVIEHRASGYEIKGGELRNQAWVSPTFNATADGTIYTTVEDMARWDRALTDGTLLKPGSLERMWTPFKLTSGKENSRRYGFGWWVDAVNGHRLIEHNGAWQGFTSDMARYPDDGLTVTVFVNLDSDHARPYSIAHVVAGLVSPALMPPLAKALPDDPKRSQSVRGFLMRAAAGQNTSADYDEGADYKFDLLEQAELAAALPTGWQNAPITLIQREDNRGGVRYGYRIGPAGNTRVVSVTITPSGGLTGYSISADPDSR
jgi:CubicO group peptidase (beta-lactamase class C family)